MCHLLLVWAQNKNIVEVPKFEGPITITETSHPFTVGGTDLEANGYVLDEYYVSGTANVYDWGKTELQNYHRSELRMHPIQPEF